MIILNTHLDRTGSFRVTQKIALRATTAAPTFFKPLLSFDELYCDGGIVASNPSAVAVHEARAVYPGVPLELLVSIGTGGKGTMAWTCFEVLPLLLTSAMVIWN